MKIFDQIRFNSYYAPKKLISFLIKGSDASDFLQGQTVNDVQNLKNKTGHINLCLNLQGRIEAIFYLYKNNQNSFLLIVEEAIVDKAVERLEKYLIAEDVEIQKLEYDVQCILGESEIHKQKNIMADSSFLGEYFGDRVLFTLNEKKLEQDQKGIDLFSQYLITNGWPNNIETILGELITSTIFINCISTTKGCYLGQEVVSKIINNRGSAYYPMYALSNEKIENGKYEFGEIFNLEKIENKNFYQIKVKREFFIEEKKLENGLVLKSYPLNINTSKNKSKYFYDSAIELYHNNKIEESIEALRICLELDSENQDAYEILSVIMGRTGNYKSAIEIISKLIEINSNSIMAHTNLSYFYMQIGDKEKAENEKSIAIGLQMMSSDGEKDTPKIDFEDLKRKEDMFMQVLEIDAEDELALKGMLEVYFERSEFSKLLEFLEKNKSEFVWGYYYKGCALLKLNRNSEAKVILENAMNMAAKSGQNKLATEIQQIINQN